MPRLALLLLTLAAVAGGGANLYLGGIEATRAVEVQLADRLTHASQAVQLLLGEEADRADAAAGKVREATARRKAPAPKAEAGEAEADETTTDGQVEEKAAAKDIPVLDDAAAKRLARVIGVDVTLVRDGKVEASSLAPSERARLAAASGASKDADFGLGELPADEFSVGSIPLPLFAPNVSAVSAKRVSLQGGQKVEAIVSLETADSLRPVVQGQKQSLLITGAIGLLGLLLLLVRGKDGAKAVGPIADVVERAADGDLSVHAAEYLPGELGRLARAVNRLVSRAKQNTATQGLSAQYPLPPKQATADELADSFPFGAQAPGTSAPHGFGSTPGPAVAREFGDATPGPFAAEFDTTRSAGPQAQGQVDPFDLARNESPPPPPPSSSPWDQVPSDPIPPPSGRSWDQPTRPLPPGAPGYSGNIDPQSWASSGGPQASAPPVPPADAYGQAIAEAMGASNDNPDATVVAAIPEALLRATSRAGTPGAGTPGPAPAQPAEDPDEAAYQQVYEDFLRIRTECGESIAGLSYEKFAQKLRTNRAQLMEKYQARTVRFTAYVKEGKAALKASPIRD